jgi:uncharacterized protein
MTQAVAALLSSKIFVATFFAWFLAQGSKVVIGAVTERRLNFRWFVNVGGMPSSHTATVTALTTSVGLDQGFGAPLFVVTLFFTIIIVFDATGFRRSVGRQAGILNTIMDDVYMGHRVPEERLRELLGHTPVQVIAGGIIGIAMGVLFFA